MTDPVVAHRDTFRHAGYKNTNEGRWRHFEGMGLPIADKSVFEPGAGIGDHSVWLLKHGPKHLYINEGREHNLANIRQQVGADPRVTILPGNIESCLGQPEFDLHVDLVYCYGILYHIKDPTLVMLRLAQMGRYIAMDFVTGHNTTVEEDATDPSQAINGLGCRLDDAGIVRLLKPFWECVYKPKTPLAESGRCVWAASHDPLDLPALDRVL